MKEQKQLNKAIHNFIQTNGEDITPAVKKLLEGLAQAKVEVFGKGFVQLSKEDVINKSGAQSLSPESLRKRVLKLNETFEQHNINASLSSRKQHYELTYDETLVAYQSDIEEIALDIAKQSNPNDYQAPEASLSPTEKWVFVSHKWLNDSALAITTDFIKHLEQQLEHSNDDKLQVKLFCDLSDVNGFNHHEEQPTQQDRFCQKSDLALILWSIGYEKSSACQRERGFFLNEEGGNQPNKAAIVILESDCFADLPKNMKTHILFSHPKNSKNTLIEFWEKATEGEKNKYVTILRSKIRDALISPPTPSRPIKDVGSTLMESNTHAIEEGLRKERYNNQELQIPHALDENHRASEKRFQIIPYLEKWGNTPCNDHKTSRVTVLLGDFGFGKTVTCRLLAQQLGECYQKDKSAALPIYLDLKALLNALNENLSAPIEHLIETMLKQTGQTSSISGQDVLQYIRQKPCLVIFDGFDEIGQKLDRAQQQQIYRKLLDIIPTEIYRNDHLRLSQKASDETLLFPSKLLISCRTHFFNHFQQETSFLHGSERHDISDNNIQRFYMAPFKPEAIKNYLASVLGKEEGDKAYTMLGGIHDLSELSSHPIMLKLICRHIPELKQINDAGKKVNSATLYLKLFDQIGERDIEKHLIQLSDKQALLAQLALTMWLKGTTNISFKKLEEWFKHFSSEHPLLKHQISVLGEFNKLVTDLCNATLLVRDEDDNYRFAHTSYLEFFRAIGIFEAFKSGQLSRYITESKVLKKTKKAAIENKNELSLDKETLQFFYNWWEICDEEDKEEFEEGFIGLLEQPNNPIEQNICFQIWQFCQTENIKNQANAISTNFPHTDAPDWSEMSFTKHFISAELRHLSLDNANFTNSYFHLIRFDRLMLNQANFRQSKLYQCYFYQCQLAQADWTEAKTNRTLIPKKTSHTSSPLSLIPYTNHANTADAIALNFAKDTDSTPSLFTASTNGIIQQWNINTGICLQTVKVYSDISHWGDVTCIALAFSNDGKLYLVSGSRDGATKLWDTSTKQCVQTLQQENNSAEITSIDLAFSANDTPYILFSHEERTLILWKANTMDSIQTLQDSSDRISCVAITFAKDDTPYIFSGASPSLISEQSPSIKRWDMKSGHCLQSFSSIVNSITLALSNDGIPYIISSSPRQPLTLRNANTGKNLQTFHQQSYDRNISLALIFSKDNAPYLFSLSVDGEIKQWDSQSKHCLQTFTKNHSRLIYETFITSTKDNNPFILNNSQDGKIKQYDAITGNLIYSFQSENIHIANMSLAHSKKGKPYIASRSFDDIRLWDTLTGQCVKTIKTPINWIGRENVTLTFSANDTPYILSSSKDNSLKLWNALSGVCTQTFKDNAKKYTFTHVTFAFSSQNTAYIFSSTDNAIKQWDMNTGNCIQTIQGHSGEITSLALEISNDDKPYLFSSSTDSTIKQWDIDTGRCIQTLNEHSQRVTTIALTFLTDNKPHLLSSSHDGTIKQWDINSGDCLQTIKTQKPASHVSFSLDHSKILATIDNNICLYNRATGKEESGMTLTDVGNYHYQVSEDGGAITIDHVTGDAWRFLYSINQDKPDEIHLACEADNWEEIYYP